MEYRIVKSDELYHYGVPGMKWRHRKGPTSLAGTGHYYKKTSQDLQSGKVGKPRNNYQRAMQALGRSKFATRAIINSKDLNAQGKAQALAEQGLLREEHRKRKRG